MRRGRHRIRKRNMTSRSVITPAFRGSMDGAMRALSEMDYQAFSAIFGAPKCEVGVTEDGRPCYRYTWGAAE